MHVQSDVVLPVHHISMCIQNVSKPMSQTFPGYSPPPIKQNSSYQHESKSEQVYRYRPMFIGWYPLEYYIRCAQCWPFAATHPLKRRIMHSSWPDRFLMASNVSTLNSLNSSTLVTGVDECGYGKNMRSSHSLTTAKRTDLYQLRYTAPKRRSWWRIQVSETRRALNVNPLKTIRICVI